MKTGSKRAFIFTGLTISLLGTAWAAPTDADVRKLQAKVSDFVMAMDGVNGNGIGDCNSRTGLIADGRARSKEPCLVIYSKTDDAAESLKSLFPAKTRVGKVLVVIENQGEIRPE